MDDLNGLAQYYVIEEGNINAPNIRNSKQCLIVC
jgi:hypothetical protein